MTIQRHPHDVPDAGLFRNTVVESRFRDEFGRRIFTALDGKGMRLREGVAASDAEALRVVAHLYESVDEAKQREFRPTIVK